jgi:hypothetical protein
MKNNLLCKHREKGKKRVEAQINFYPPSHFVSHNLISMNEKRVGRWNKKEGKS